MNTTNMQRMLVTPDQATIWLQSNNINRTVRNHWVSQLANQIKDGNWIVTHQGIALSQSGVLLDGQHRLMAIQKAQIPVEMFVCTDADESIYKAIDCGIKRSMADLTRLGKLDAEAANRVCKIVHNGRNSSPDKVMLIGNSSFIKTHGKLVQFCSARAKYYGSVNSRISACLAIELGSNFDYVAQLYADLNRMDIRGLPPIASCLIKQVANNSAHVNDNGDCLARTFKVFNQYYENYTRLIINQQDIEWTYAMIKKLFATKYALKG